MSGDETNIGDVHGNATINEARRDILQAGQNIITGNGITVVIGDQDQKGKKAAKEIPRLLPYLADRVDQELVLGKAIKSFCDFTRPFICIIHGEEKQCSDMFIERVFHRSLAQIIPAQTGKEIKRFELSSDRFSNYQQFHTKMDASLSIGVAKELFASQEKVAEVLAKEDTPVLLRITLSSQDCLENKGAKAIEFFLQYWQQWKVDAGQKNLLLICLCFDYMPIQVGFWGRLWDKDLLNTQLRDYLNNLNFAQFSLQGVVLPELGEIIEKQVQDWARLHKNDIHEQLHPKITEIFQDSKKQSLAMQPLANQLKKMLEDFA